MTIKPVAGNIFVGKVNSEKTKETAEKNESRIKDKLELSEEAKNIQKSSAENSKLDKIKERINSNYYNSEEVINKVAENILKEIQPDN